MPHAVKMPSFLADDAGPMLSQNGPSLDAPSHPRQSHEKLNGNARSPSHTSIKGSLGEGSEAHVDGGSSSRPVMNGEVQHDTSLSSIPNGRSSASSWDHKSSQNGSALSVNGASNGVPDIGGKNHVTQNTLPRSTNGEGNSGSLTNGNLQNSPTDMAPKLGANGESEPQKKIPIPPLISSNPQSTGPLMYTSSLLPTTTSQNETPSRATTSSPHRFSSPPAYSSQLASSSTHTSTQHPGSAQLKHRHTLQVPKLGAVRNSRDGEDGVYSSGRFSPTTIAAGVRRGSLSLNRRNTQSIHSNMPHEEIPPDEDAMRWAEAVRQKRASKRRRKDEEDDDRVVVGTKVDQNHVNWVTAYNMLTGIRFTVSRTNAKLDRPLTDADFDARHKFSFDM